MESDWYRIESIEELEHFIRGGWTNFTLRPLGSTMWIYINEELFDKGEACLALPGFQKKRQPNWMAFKEFYDSLRVGRQVCVPGPLTAHDHAQLEIGRIKTLNRKACASTILT